MRFLLPAGVIAGTVVLVTVLAIVLLGGPGGIPWQGWAAMGVGIVVTAGLGGGLMMLMFYSDRAGYDDAASELGTKPEDDRREQ
jgi:hypothetical protein